LLERACYLFIDIHLRSPARVRVSFWPRPRPVMSVSIFESDHSTSPLSMQWFTKTAKQVALAISRAKSIGYKPLEDPKYALGDINDRAEDEDDEAEQV